MPIRKHRQMDTWMDRQADSSLPLKIFILPGYNKEMFTNMGMILFLEGDYVSNRSSYVSAQAFGKSPNNTNIQSAKKSSMKFKHINISKDGVSDKNEWNSKYCTKQIFSLNYYDISMNNHQNLIFFNNRSYKPQHLDLYECGRIHVLTRIWPFGITWVPSTRPRCDDCESGTII